METWLWLGILSYLFFAISSSIDKYFMNNQHNPVGTNTLKMLFNGLILLMIGFLFFELSVTRELLLWSLLLGGTYALIGILYFTALKFKEAKVVVPCYQSSNILLIFIGSVILFDEVVNIYNYVGIVLILMGVYAVLSEKGFKLPRLDKAVFLILGVIILSVIYSLLVKDLLSGIKPINLAIMMYFSSALILFGYILLSKKQKKSFSIKSSKIISASFFGALGTFLLYSALVKGDASKVYPLAGLQSVFVFIIALVFLREKFHWYKLVGTVLVFFGIFLISL